MRIAVVGVGGVGGYFGGRLAQAGEEVVFIARGAHLRALRERGLRVESVEGDFVVQPVEATDDPATVGPVDAVIVAVKAWQVPEVAPTLRPLLGPETCVVPLENGVEAPEQLAAALGAAHTLGGLARIFSAIAGPGHIRHRGLAPFVAFGELDHQRSPRAERLLEAFTRAGVKAEIPSDIHAALWDKFITFAAFAGVGSVTRAPIGVMRVVPETRRMLEQAMREVLAVAQARGVALSDAVVEQAMRFMDGSPAEATSSMQRDVGAGRPSELESQSGAVVRIGQEVGVATPVHAFIYASLLPLEMRARGEIAFPA